MLGGQYDGELRFCRLCFHQHGVRNVAKRSRSGTVTLSPSSLLCKEARSLSMKHVFPAIVLVFATGAALAQTASPPANQNPSTPAISNTDRNNPGAPAAGANSFTEGQVKSRIEAAGYTNVSNLAKDKDGVWRAKGSKGGKATDVSLDYQGNIVAK
jgi:hypothetical protein